MRTERTAIRSKRWTLDAADREYVDIGEGYKARVTGYTLFKVEILFRGKVFTSAKDFHCARNAVEWRDGLKRRAPHE